MNNSDKKVKIIDTLLNYIPLFISFLLPLWFLPITVEFFEFNKLTLLTGATIVMLVLWSVKIVLTKQVIIAKSKIDVALALFIVSFVLSTIFSINQSSSLFGSSGRWYPSLFGLITFFVFYYITASNITAQTVKKIIPVFLVSVTVSTFVSLLSYYNIFLGSANFLKLQTFSLSGSTTVTVLLATLGFILSLSYMYMSKNAVAKSGFVLMSLVNLYYALLVNDWELLIVLAVGLLALVAFTSIKTIKEEKLFSLVSALGIVLVVICIYVPFLREVTVNADFPSRINLSIADSWRVATSTIREFPILGTGPSTFYLNFPRYRTISMNNGDFWNFRFDKPYNELFDVIATLGILGTAVYIFLGIRTVKLAFEAKSQDQDSGIVGLIQTGLVMSVAFSLVTYSTVTTDFVYFLFLALLVGYKASTSEVNQYENSVASLTNWYGSNNKGITKKEYLHLIAITPLLGLTALGAYLSFKLYSGEYQMRQALNSASNNNGNLTYEYEIKALQANPRVDSYHNIYAQTNLALANAIAGRKDLSDKDKQTIQTLVSQAIRSVRTSTEALNPLNVAGWETRANIYRSIIGIANDADKWAIQAFNTAIQLDPTNPLLRVQLGGIYYGQKDYLAAANQFRTAATLKPDYANAYYNLGLALSMLQDYKNAEKSFLAAQRLVPENSNDSKVLATELDKVRANIPAVAGATDDKLNVDAVSTTTPNTSTTQPPLVSPTETEKVSTNSTAPTTTVEQ